MPFEKACWAARVMLVLEVKELTRGKYKTAPSQFERSTALKNTARQTLARMIAFFF